MQAIEIFNRHQDEIHGSRDCLGLPKLGGWEAIQKMREIRPSLKTLIASAFVPPKLEIEIAQAALDGVIASRIN